MGFSAHMCFFNYLLTMFLASIILSLVFFIMHIRDCFSLFFFFQILVCIICVALLPLLLWHDGYTEVIRHDVDVTCISLVYASL